MNIAASVEFKKARSYAFRLLKIRARSEAELKFRLREKDFTLEVIIALTDYLKGVGYLNDSEFAQNFVRERIKKSFGSKRLEFELSQKGIAKEIITAVLAEAKKEYPERQAIIDLIKDKFKKPSGQEFDDRAKTAICGYLSRRGFSPEAITDVLEEL